MGFDVMGSDPQGALSDAAKVLQAVAGDMEAVGHAEGPWRYLAAPITIGNIAALDLDTSLYPGGIQPDPKVWPGMVHIESADGIGFPMVVFPGLSQAYRVTQTCEGVEVWRRSAAS